MPYIITRPIMTAAELATHKVESHGRDYRLSDDGYDDMEVNAKQGWRSLGSWGADGWDLGDWPYVVISIRERDDRFDLMQVVEGDHTAYSFASREDRDAAIDYLFLWYAAGKDTEPSIGADKRELLDVGHVGLRIEDRFRGPFRTS